MNDKSLIDAVVRQRVAVLNRQYPGCEIVFEATNGRGQIQVTRDDKPEHFEIVLDENYFSRLDEKVKILDKANGASVTVLIPDVNEFVTRCYRGEFLYDSGGKVDVMAYNKDGVIREIRLQ